MAFRFGATAESLKGVWRRHRSRSPLRSSTASSSSTVRLSLAEPEPEPEPGEDLLVKERQRRFRDLQVDQSPVDLNVFGGRSR